jgi:hypothetical protein
MKNALVTELPEEEEDDGLLAVVKRDCSGQPPPHIERFIALDNRVHASTNFTEALDILEQANLTDDEYNYLNSSLFDGLRYAIYGRHQARERKMNCCRLGISSDSPTLRLLHDQVVVTRSVVRSGKTAAAKFLMRRGINLAHVKHVAIEALLSDNPRMMELVWPRVLFDNLYNYYDDRPQGGHIYGRYSADDARTICACRTFYLRKMKSFRWLLENGHISNPDEAFRCAILQHRIDMNEYESEIALAMELGLKFASIDDLECKPECQERLLRHGVQHGTWHGCYLTNVQWLKRIMEMGFVPTPQDLEIHLTLVSRSLRELTRHQSLDIAMEMMKHGVSVSDVAIASAIDQKDFWLIGIMVDHGYDPRNILPAMQRLRPGCEIPRELHPLIEQKEKNAVVGQKRARDASA